MRGQGSEREVGFKIYRGVDAPGIEESGIEKHREDTIGPPAGIMETLSGLADPGYSHRVLFAERGISLLHLWFKSGFVLPRHRHDTDCLYFVLAGTLRIGTADLEAGDGFFVGADVPYTYAVGDDGVEVLEFRAAESFYLDLMVQNEAFWTKLARTMQDKQPAWREEARPGAFVSG